MVLPLVCRYIDQSTCVAYYYNRETGETTWDAPPNFVSHDSVLDFADEMDENSSHEHEEERENSASIQNKQRADDDNIHVTVLSALEATNIHKQVQSSNEKSTSSKSISSTNSDPTPRSHRATQNRKKVLPLSRKVDEPMNGDGKNVNQMSPEQKGGNGGWTEVNRRHGRRRRLKKSVPAPPKGIPNREKVASASISHQTGNQSRGGAHRSRSRKGGARPPQHRRKTLNDAAQLKTLHRLSSNPPKRRGGRNKFGNPPDITSFEEFPSLA